MNQDFRGWQAVAEDLRRQASEAGVCLNDGQRASLRAIGERLPKNGVILADEVGMGKTRIAVCVARAVNAAGGRVALLVPPGLGFQWQSELRDGGVDQAPDILRSLWGYFKAWENSEAPQPWFGEPIVMLSHAFANWRSSKNQSWQWELLPMLYAEWRRETTGRRPRRYHASEGEESQRAWDPWVSDAAESICKHIDEGKNSLSRHVMEQISADTPWPGALDRDGYSSNTTLRRLLETAIGLGLGIFDLVIIDEAHKSRGTESGLERLLENIVLESGNARRLAMTATPVELNVSQWEQILGRIRAPNAEAINKTIECYAEAVHRVRQCWSSNEDARKKYAEAAGAFQSALSPYLLRRDKRQDEAVRRFVEETREPHDAYRRKGEIEIAPKSLTPAWRQALCAAESLSLVAASDDATAKRLRLTIGNGHGIAAILDEVTDHEQTDPTQEEIDEQTASAPIWAPPLSDMIADKRNMRANWWRKVIASVFSGKDQGLYDHPAILAAVEAIGTDTTRGEKVLVFGRFTQPMRDLVHLLNARALLRALENGAPWPQSKVHEDELDAVKAAHRQLQCAVPFDEIDHRLEKQYNYFEKRRECLRENLFKWIEEGLSQQQHDERALLEAARSSRNEDARPLLARALDELMEIPEQFESTRCAKAFVDLMAALRDRNEVDANGDNGLDEEEAGDLWSTLEQRLRDEYGVQRGTFARMMYGGTPQATRRLLQLAFNRENSFPKVLVAQSMVGREGLNLHQACKVVLLLHPEWNPGVVEQQIGRVDRVGSRWARELDDAIAKSADIPRIEIRPVIFAGTYDEHNWKVLLERWDDLRAQLHGVIVPARERSTADGNHALIKQLDAAGPDFSPQETSMHCRKAEGRFERI